MSRAAGPAFCTVVAKNYLAYARVLGRSLAVQHPDVPVYVLLVDEVDGCFAPEGEPFSLLSLGDLPLPRPREMRFRYDVLELSTAVKPFLLEVLLGRGHDRVIFLDPDIRVYRRLERALALLNDADMVLTPHLTSPLADDDVKHPSEREILMAGAYNLGFLGVARSPAIDRFLRWWASRCEEGCVAEPERGLFVDQRWMDLAPGLLDRVHVLRDPGYNVAYWNLHDRRLEGPVGAARVNDEPLVFFHFSGLDPLKPGLLSRHQDRYPSLGSEPLSSLVRAYSAEVLAAGHQASSRWPYSHGVFRDGHPIGREMRELFREQPMGRFPDPFQVEGEGSFLEWAITPARSGGLSPLAARLQVLWSGKGRGGWLSRLGSRALSLLDGDREASAGPLCPEPLAPVARRILSKRRDVKEAFSRPGGDVDRGRFLRWLAKDGVLRHQLKPAWTTRWLGEAQGEGVMPRLLRAWDGSATLQRRFPMAFVEEHDAPAFLNHALERPDEVGLSGADRPQLRRLLADGPALRISELYRGRPDIAQAFPEALAWPGDPTFLAWLRYSGRREYGVSEEWVLWFERARAQHVCRRIHLAWRTRPEWQARHPLAFSPFGRGAFLAWLRGPGAAELGADVSGLDRLCPPSAVLPLEDLKRLHRSDERVRALFPRAFVAAADTEGLVSWVRGERRDFGLDEAWLGALEEEVAALGLGEGATVVGYLRTESGMGEIARANLRALEAVDYAVAAVNLEEAPQRQADLSVSLDSAGAPMPFVIVHANAPEAYRQRERLSPWLEGRYVIGCWAWELGALPPEWTECFSLFDEVWTCSRHAAAAIALSSPVPVQALWPSVPEPRPSRLTRGELGLDDQEFTFLFAYDLLSESERKNPLGLIEAFREAFRRDDRVRLVLKATNGEMRPDDMRRVRAAAQGIPVTILESYLARPDVLGLMAACDAYVSLHRAEGFGFTLAEAMALGKPVVATYYSGNVDFMTPWNSFPVPYRLAEIPEDRGPYRKGSVWAEPDLSAAAALMRKVYRERELAAEVAARGQADVRRLLSPRACGQRLAERLRTVARDRLRRAPLA
jgi:glycosyltransferase involved in cell wall biosynthesis